MPSDGQILRHGLARLEACRTRTRAYSFVTGLLGAAQRLCQFGHTEIQSVLESLEPVITAVCERHVDDDAAAMASFAPLAEIMGMRHERAGRRLFMSYRLVGQRTLTKFAPGKRSCQTALYRRQ